MLTTLLGDDGSSRGWQWAFTVVHTIQLFNAVHVVLAVAEYKLNKFQH